MKSGNGKSTIDIESLVKELMTCKQRGEKANKRSRCKITRVNEQKPDVVCIGPYYNDPFHRMEPEKKAVLLGMLPVEEQQQADMLTRLVNAISAVEKEARDHYGDRASRMRSAEFLQMLLLDGCFILGMFVLPHCCPGTRDGGGADGRAMRNIALVRDVFYLLGNQIPFCVLNEIHKVVHGPSSSSSTSTAVAVTLARQLREILQHLGYSLLHVSKPSPWHLLHLLHMHLEPSEQPQRHNDEGGNNNKAADVSSINCGLGSSTSTAVYRWRGAMQYLEAGVKFKKRHLGGTCATTTSARTLLDVKLNGLTLHVPSLTVDDNTFRILRSLMMLEYYNPEELGSHVTAYCLFMSQLAGTSRDVELLAKKGIIVHALPTDSDVAERLAGLCSGVIIDLDEPTHNYLHRTRKDLERLYDSRKVKCLTLPRRKTWHVVALFAAIVMLLCQLLQAIYTTKSYYRTLHMV